MSRRELSDFEAARLSYFEFEIVLMAFWPLEKCSVEVDDPPEARTWEIVGIFRPPTKMQFRGRRPAGGTNMGNRLLKRFSAIVNFRFVSEFV